MITISKVTKKRLGDILLEEGVLKKEQLDEALKKQKAEGGLLGKILEKLGYVKEIDIVAALVKQFNLPYINVAKYVISKEVLDIVPADFCYKNQFVILDKIGKVLVIGISGPVDVAVFDELERVSGCRVFAYLSTSSAITATLEKYFPRK